MSDSAVQITGLSVDISAEDLVPEFRAVTIAGTRKGFRLEKLYWRLLDELAHREGMRRSVLIASILDQAEASATNGASAIRSYVTRSIESDRDRASNELSQPKIVRLLQQAPMPAFAINRERRLQMVNSEFTQLVRVTIGNMTEHVPTDTTQLKLDTRIEELFAQAETKGWTACNYHITVGDRSRRGRTKLVAAPPYPSTILVGYVVS